jgi:uncharacterized membrane protein YoaK (UPF0700 family)
MTAKPVHPARPLRARNIQFMLQACLLALIAGYADAAGFLSYDAFAGLMTGNTILLGIALSNEKLGAAVFQFAIIAAFMLGVILARVFLRLDGRPRTPLLLVAALLILCGFLDREIAAPVLAFAMGMQNSAAHRFNGISLNTVFITGNLQKLGEGVIAWVWPHEGGGGPDGVGILAAVWAAYAAGAGAGAVAYNNIAFPLILPAAVLPFVALTVTKQLPRAPGRHQGALGA